MRTSEFKTRTIKKFNNYIENTNLPTDVISKLKSNFRREISAEIKKLMSYHNDSVMKTGLDNFMLVFIDNIDKMYSNVDQIIYYINELTNSDKSYKTNYFIDKIKSFENDRDKILLYFLNSNTYTISDAITFFKNINSNPKTKENYNKQVIYSDSSSILNLKNAILGVENEKQHK